MADLLNAPVIELSDKTNAENTVEDRSDRITSNLIQSLKKEVFSSFLIFISYKYCILYFYYSCKSILLLFTVFYSSTTPFKVSWNLNFYLLGYYCP